MHTIDLVGNRASGGEIPDSHRDLAECPPVAALTTLGADGWQQVPETRVMPDPRPADHARRDPRLKARGRRRP